jgi:hypothetical protein
MKITLKQSYLVAFQLLDEVFDDTKEVKLGILLSGMNPYLFSDSIPADPAMWHEWSFCIKKVSKDNLYKSDDILAAINIFLKLNREHYGYEMNWLIHLLEEKVRIGRWKEIFQKASVII